MRLLRQGILNEEHKTSDRCGRIAVDQKGIGVCRSDGRGAAGFRSVPGTWSPVTSAPAS